MNLWPRSNATRATFSADTIDDPNDVVLDYSTTIASPKKNISCLLARFFQIRCGAKTMSTRMSST